MTRGTGAGNDAGLDRACDPNEGGQPDWKVSAPRRARKRVVVLGEFNSGKTALVNAIVGAEVLKPSLVTHTAHLTVVRFAAKPSMWAETNDGRRMALTWGPAGEETALPDIRRLHIGVPIARLQSMSVTDTPGFGLADCDGDAATLDACGRACAVIWCTPAMQAWKASEEQAWLALPERVRRRGMLAVTFADEIASPSDVDRLMARLRTEAAPYFRAIAMAGECADLLAQ
jgi:hypothetical protein